MRVEERAARVLRVVLAGSCLGAALWGCADGPSQPSAVATLTVDDADFLGSLGDARLSIDEALRLAAGTLDVSALSDAERARLDGAPGRGSADTIHFARGLRVSIRRREEALDSILPALTDPGDAIDGTGAILDGAAMEGRPQPGRVRTVTVTDEEFGTTSSAALLVLAASRTSVRGLTIESVPATAIAVAGSGAEVVAGVRVTGNEIRGLGRNSASGGVVAVAGFNADGATIEDLEITANRVADANSGVFVAAGSASGAGAGSRDNLGRVIAIRDNRIERVITAIIAYGGQAALGAGSHGNRLEDVEISGNLILDNLDVGILASTTQGTGEGETSGNSIESLAIRDNVLAWSGTRRANVALYLSGGQMFAGGSSSGDRIAGVVVERNRAAGYGTGIQAIGGVVERCGIGCATASSVLQALELRENRWTEVDTGVLLAGGGGFEAAATVADSTLADVVLEREAIDASGAGLLIAGSLASSLPLGGDFLGSRIRFPGYRETGIERDNTVRDVVVRDAVIRAPSAVVISGGTMNRTEDRIERSRVAHVLLERSVIDGGETDLVVLGGVVVASGWVADCEVADVRSVGSSAGDGSILASTVLPEAAVDGANPFSVRGNRARDVRVE